MKSIQSLIEPKEQLAPLSRQEQREARALSLAKKFLNSLLEDTEYFVGEAKEGQSLRRQSILKDSFDYFVAAHGSMRGSVGRLSCPLIADFLERFYQYEVNNNKKMTVPLIKETIEQYQGATQ